jgi:putative membrane protein
MKRALIGSAVVLAMTAAPALAQSGTQTTHTQTETKTQSTATSAATADHKFVMDAAKGGMAEVELGKLAADKASSSQVKQFGQRMVTDHSKANDELKSIANSKNITLPTDLDAKDKALHDRLSKLSGSAFDRAYMEAMLRDHQKDVNEFKRESTSGKDSVVKAFAAKTLPTLEEHLKLAQDTNRAVGTSGTVEKGSSGSSGATGSTGSGTTNPNPGASGTTPRR